MPSIQIKDVPADTHAVLRQRAAQSRRSLQEYLLGKLIADAEMPTVDELLARAGGRSGGDVTFGAAVDQLRRDRDRR